MILLVRSLAAPLLCLLTLSACADHIPVWDPPAGLGICDRTQAVREEIVARTARVNSWAFVDPQELSTLRALDLSERGIAALQAGDFAGLDRLRELRLNGNALRALPDGVFDGLHALRILHLHDNPGAPFPLRLDLRADREGDERWLYLRLPLRPPGRVVAHLQADGVALSHVAAVLDEGSLVGQRIKVGRTDASATTARVIRVALDRETRDCDAEPCWTGIRLSAHLEPVAIPALPGGGEPPRGLPTLVLRLDAQSFAHDAVIERGVLSGSGGWRYYQYAERPQESDFSGECTVTEHTRLTHGGGGMSGTNEYDGACRLAMGSGSSTPAYALPLKRVGGSTVHDTGPDVRSGDPCLASPDLRIAADAASFDATERLDAVNFDAGSRCYYYISVAQDPNRAAPFRFADGQSCVVELVDRQIAATGCTELVWWGGWGFGGIDSLAQARADAALTRPYVHGEEQLGRLAAIAACETLPEVSLSLDGNSFRESAFHYRTVHDQDGLCQLTIRAMAPADAFAATEQCTVSARFVPTSAVGIVPTRQSGDCERIVHYASWSRPSGIWSEQEQQAFVDQYSAQLASLSDAEWRRLREDYFCIDDICAPLPPAQ